MEREALIALSGEHMQARCGTVLFGLLGSWLLLAVLQSSMLRAEHESAATQHYQAGKSQKHEEQM